MRLTYYPREDNAGEKVCRKVWQNMFQWTCCYPLAGNYAVIQISILQTEKGLFTRARFVILLRARQVHNSLLSGISLNKSCLHYSL